MDLGNRYCNHENLYVIENKARRWKIRNANIKELEAGESEVNGQSSATQVNSRQPGLNEILPSTKLKNITYREISSFLFSVWFWVAFWIFFPSTVLCCSVAVTVCHMGLAMWLSERVLA